MLQVGCQSLVSRPEKKAGVEFSRLAEGHFPSNLVNIDQIIRVPVNVINPRYIRSEMPHTMYSGYVVAIIPAVASVTTTRNRTSFTFDFVISFFF